MLLGTSLLLSIGCILAHELGHFITARLLHVSVSEFCIGYGTVVWQKTFGETQYILRMLPLAGQVIFDGNAPLGKKFMVFLAGPLTNLILAVILMQVSSTMSGRGHTLERLAQWDKVDSQDEYSLAASVSRSYGLINLMPIAGFDGRECLVLVARFFYVNPKKTLKIKQIEKSKELNIVLKQGL